MVQSKEELKELERAFCDLLKQTSPYRYTLSLVKRSHSTYPKLDAEDLMQETFAKMSENSEQTISAWKDGKICSYWKTCATYTWYNFSEKIRNEQWNTEELDALTENEEMSSYYDTLVKYNPEETTLNALRLYEWKGLNPSVDREKFKQEHAIQWDWNRIMLYSELENNVTPFSQYYNTWLDSDTKRAFVHLLACSNRSVTEVNLFEDFFNERKTTQEEWRRVNAHLKMMKNGENPKFCRKKDDK